MVDNLHLNRRISRHCIYEAYIDNTNVSVKHCIMTLSFPTHVNGLHCVEGIAMYTKPIACCGYIRMVNMLFRC